MFSAVKRMLARQREREVQQRIEFCRKVEAALREPDPDVRRAVMSTLVGAI